LVFGVKGDRSFILGDQFNGITLAVQYLEGLDGGDEYVISQ
jgi:hypothetical protein